MNQGEGVHARAVRSSGPHTTSSLLNMIQQAWCAGDAGLQGQERRRACQTRSPARTPCRVSMKASPYQVDALLVLPYQNSEA